MKVEVVRGAMTETLGDELVAFWTGHGALSEEAAHERLADVVCVLRDESGAVAGISSVYETDLDLVGGRRFFVFRSFAPAGPEAERELLAATHSALDDAFEVGAGGPLGVVVALDPAAVAQRPEAMWEPGPFLYAGVLPDGRRVWVGYFRGARVAGGTGAEIPDRPLADSPYRIVPFDEQDTVGEQDLIDLWTNEARLAPAVARERVEQALLVAIDPDGRAVGAHTAFARRNPQLGLNLWYGRMFVAPSAQRSDLAMRFSLTGRNVLSGRYASGRDRHVPGVAYVIANEGLRTRFDHAHWAWVGFRFVGLSDRGHHVYVHYFPGATVQGST